MAGNLARTRLIGPDRRMDLHHLSEAGTEIPVRVTPKAARSLIVVEAGKLRVCVTGVPENGKANAAVQRLSAKAIGVPKSRLFLLRGATSRDKVFREGGRQLLTGRRR